jgi:hypothetical protein
MCFLVPGRDESQAAVTIATTRHSLLSEQFFPNHANGLRFIVPPLSSFRGVADSVLRGVPSLRVYERQPNKTFGRRVNEARSDGWFGPDQSLEWDEPINGLFWTTQPETTA